MIEVTQKYSDEMYKKCSRVLMKRMMLTMLICGLVIIGVSIAFYFDSIVDGVIFSALGVFFVIMYFALPHIMIKANAKNKHLMQKFQFAPDAIKVDVYSIAAGEDRAILVASSACKYTNFYDCREIDGIVYLFLNKTMAYIIEAKSFPTEADKLMVLGYYKNARKKCGLPIK